MADKGVIVQDAISGESVGCVDLRNQDESSNSRIVQLSSSVTSPATGLVGAETGTPLRTLDFGTSGTKSSPGTGDSFDNADYANTPTDIKNNLLDVSDSSAFVLYFSVDYSDMAAEMIVIQVMPVAYNDTPDEVAFPFTPSLIRIVNEDAYNPTNKFQFHELYNSQNVTGFFRKTSGGSVYYALPLCYPTYGVKNVGVYMSSHLANNFTVKAFGYPLTGQAADAALTAVVHQNYGHASYMLLGGGTAS